MRYIFHQPLPLQGIKVNEEDITHAPQGYNRFLPLRGMKAKVKYHVRGQPCSRPKKLLPVATHASGEPPPVNGNGSFSHLYPLLARKSHCQLPPRLVGVAEGVGFEPTELSFNGFQDRRLKPLGHPS